MSQVLNWLFFVAIFTWQFSYCSIATKTDEEKTIKIQHENLYANQLLPGNAIITSIQMLQVLM